MIWLMMQSLNLYLFYKSEIFNLKFCKIKYLFTFFSSPLLYKNLRIFLRISSFNLFVLSIIFFINCITFSFNIYEFIRIRFLSESWIRLCFDIIFHIIISDALKNISNCCRVIRLFQNFLSKINNWSFTQLIMIF